MSPILIKTIQFFMSLSLLIVLHELGHFIPAKIFKTRVEKFFLFFDVKYALFKKKIGETVYGIGWLPLGGYVKIAGMIDESMDTAQMAEEPKPWEFRTKPAWQRLIIMLGGVTVNFILAVIIYIGMAYSYGDEYIPLDSLKDGIWVTEENIGDKLGVKTGDRIIAVDGEPVERYRDLFGEIINGDQITIVRDGQTIEQDIPVDFIATLLEDEDKIRFFNFRIPFVLGPIPNESHNKDSGLQKEDIITRIGSDEVRFFDQAKPILERYTGQATTVRVDRKGDLLEIPVQVSDSATLGVRLGGILMEDLEQQDYFRLETRKYTFAQAIPAGITQGWNTLSSYAKQLKKIFNPETGAYKGVGGFAAIGSLFPDTWDWRAFWNTTALISIILAFMNILPIPALDGGHVAFLLYEMVSGRKPSDRFLEFAQMIGFFLLIALLLFANGNDIYKWLVK